MHSSGMLPITLPASPYCNKLTFSQAALFTSKAQERKTWFYTKNFKKLTSIKAIESPEP